MIKYKFVHECTCDRCGRIEVAYNCLQADFMKKLRTYGWVLGQQDICPSCKKEPKQMTLFDLKEDEKG